MIEFKNKSRVEAILENMLGATNNLKPPQSRIEILLIELLHLIEEMSHGSGTIFRFLGEKEYVDDLPETGNEQGDVWFVKEKMAGFIWIVREDYPDGYWEELGEVIDTASLENVFFPVQYNLTEYDDILDAIQSNKIPILILYPSQANTQRRLAYFGYNNDSGAHFYELSSDSEITEYLVNNTSPSWKSPRSITFVNSVNGKTGTVTLTAEDVGATPEIFLVTVTKSNGLYSADKTFEEISAAYTVGKPLFVQFPFTLNNYPYEFKIELYPMQVGSIIAGFSGSFVNSDYALVLSCSILADGTISVAQSNYLTEASISVSHAPYIGDGGYWYEWDDTSGNFINTYITAQGPQGDPGDPGSEGPPGDSAFAIVDLGTDFTTIQNLDDSGKTLVFSDSGNVGLMYARSANVSYTFIVNFGSGYHLFTCVNGQTPEWTTETVHLPTSVDGQTGDVELQAVRVPIVVVNSSMVMMQAGMDPVALFGLFTSGQKVIFGTVVSNGNDFEPDGRVWAMDSQDPSTGQIDLHCIKAGILYQITMNYNGTQYSGTMTQINLASSPFMTATLTISVSDWVNGSCTKTVTGMTADALAFVKYSDTETEFTETQGTNSLTFTAATTPSEAVTVGVTWFKEVSA